jgi:hypothetical protein
MTLSSFDDKSNKPNTQELKAALGRTSRYWDTLVAHLAKEYEPLEETWNFGSGGWGWALRLKQKKRTVLYMTPCRGYFMVGFALGEKAVKAALSADLPESILSIIADAKKYAEGRAVRLEIRNKGDVRSVKILAGIKMDN